MKSNVQGVDLSIIGPKGNFARPVNTANSTDTVNGSAVSENQSAKLEPKPVIEPATNQVERFSSLLLGSKIMTGERRGIRVI